MNDPKRKLYDYLISNSIIDKNIAYDQFMDKVSDEGKRKKIFDYLYQNKVIKEDYASFNNKLGFESVSKKKEDMGLSSPTSSTDGQLEIGTKAQSAIEADFVSRDIERAEKTAEVAEKLGYTDRGIGGKIEYGLDVASGVFKGFYNFFNTAKTALGRRAELFFPSSPDAKKRDMSDEERLRYFDENIKEKYLATRAEIKDQDKLDVTEWEFAPEALGAQIGDGVAQILTAGAGGVGFFLSYLSSHEKYYDQAVKEGIPEKKAYVESGVFGLTESLMDRFLGVENVVGKAVAKKGIKTVGKGALEQIGKKVLEKESFGAIAKTANSKIKNILLKGKYVGKVSAIEAADEFLQEYAVTGEKEFLDLVEERTAKEGENVDLYNEEFFGSKTLRSALNGAFFGGIIGGIGGIFTTSRAYGSTVYSSLYQSYEKDGVEGLNKTVTQIGRGIDTAFENGKMTDEEYTNANRHLSQIKENVQAFDQGSKIPLNVRYQIYDLQNNVSENNLRTLSEIMSDVLIANKKVNEASAKADLEAGNTIELEYDNAFQVPEAFASYLDDQSNDEYKAQLNKQSDGERKLKAVVPKSVYDTQEINSLEKQRATNMVLQELMTRFGDPKKRITLNDLKFFGDKTSFGFVNDSNRLQFEEKFREKTKSLTQFVRATNYIKGAINRVQETGEAIPAQEIMKSISSAVIYDKGDSASYNGKVRVIENVSDDGQRIKLQGVKEEVSALDENLKPYTGQMPEKGVKFTAKQELEQEVIEEQEGYTIGDAINDGSAVSWNGKTGVITQLDQYANGQVIFTDDRGVEYEIGRLEEIGKDPLTKWGMSYSSVQIQDDNSVIINGERFTNSQGNPLDAVKYNEKGRPQSVTLYNENGQKRTIRGGRALAIEMQYQWKNLLENLSENEINELTTEVETRVEATRDDSETTVEPTEGTARKILTEEEIARKRRVKQILNESGAEAAATYESNRATIGRLAESLSKSGIRVDVLDSRQIKERFGFDITQGVFISDEGRIIINESVLSREYGKTVIFHEGIHPIVNIIRNTDLKAYNKLIDAIKAEAKQNVLVSTILNKSRVAYKDRGEFVVYDETLVEVLANVASGKLRLTDVKPSLKQMLIDFINKIGKVFGFEQVLNDTKEVELRKLSDQITNILTAGRSIDKIVGAENISKYKSVPSSFRDANGRPLTVGDVQFTLYNKLYDTRYGVEYIYIRDQNQFKALKDAGVITDDKVLSDFKKSKMILHMPDAAYTGEINKVDKVEENGKIVEKREKISDGSGGVYFPIKFYDKKYLWASTADGIRTFIDKALENVELNNGKLYLALTTGSFDKLTSSHTFVKDTISLFKLKVLQDYNISENELSNIFQKAALSKKVITKKDKKTGKVSTKTITFDFVEKDFAGKSFEEVMQIIEDRSKPDNSSFDTRKNFIAELANNLANYAAKNQNFSNQLGKFLHIGLSNDLYKQQGKIDKKYKLSKANIINSLSHMFTEPVLSYRNQEDVLDAGHVYAILEVDTKGVENALTETDITEHPSYPKAIKMAEGVDFKLHLLQDRVNWTTAFYDDKTNSHIGKLEKSVQQSIYPTNVGLTTRSLTLEDMQMSLFGREEFPIADVLSSVGFNEESLAKWEKENKVSYKQKQNPAVKQAALDLENGDKTLEQYVETVRKYLPIKPIDVVPQIPSFKQIIGALISSKRVKGVIGLQKFFDDGLQVSSRLDIPAYENYNTWVVTIHNSKGQAMAYGQTAVLTDVKFGAKPIQGALDIATQRQNKFPFATIDGRWKNEDPKAVYERALKLMTDPEWSQVGVNPYRHSFFYDRHTGEPVVAAEEVVQVGALVLAKNVQYAPFGTEAFDNHFTFLNKRTKEYMQFSEISRNEQEIRTFFSKNRNEDEAVLLEAAKEKFGISEQEARSYMSFVKNNNNYDKVSSTTILQEKGIGQQKLDEISESTESANNKYNDEYLEDRKRIYDEKNADKSGKKAWNSFVKATYDAKFPLRKFLEKAGDKFSVSAARLRNINGIIAKASNEFKKSFNAIYQDMDEKQISVFDNMLFALRVIDVENRNEAKYQAEVKNQINKNEQVIRQEIAKAIETRIQERMKYDRKLTRQAAEANAQLSPSEIQDIRDSVFSKNNPQKKAREIVPYRKSGKITLNGKTMDYTGNVAKQYLDEIKSTMPKPIYEEYLFRADLYKQVGQNIIDELLAAGIISKDAAADYRNDFYMLRKTLERVLQDKGIIYVNQQLGVDPRGFVAMSKEGTEKILERDSRLLLAETVFNANRAITKNKLNSAISEDFIFTPENFFTNPTLIQDLKPGKKSIDVSPYIRPAKYVRNSQTGEVIRRGGEYQVEPADQGFVNIPFKKDGIIQHFQLKEEFAEQLDFKENFKEAVGFGEYYVRATDVLNRTLTGFATRHNPVFFIGNLSMDLGQQVYFTDIWTQGSFVKSNIYSAKLRALARTLSFVRKTDKLEEVMQEAMDAGLMMDYISVSKEQRKRSIDIRYSGKTDSKGKAVFDWAKKMSSSVNERFEIALRLAAYDQAKKNITQQMMDENGYRSENEISDADKLRIQEIAASKARAYTDFAQKGSQLPKLNIAYLNSTVQALGSATEYVAENPLDATGKAAQMFFGKALQTFLTMAIMGASYDDLDEYLKDTYSIDVVSLFLSKVVGIQLPDKQILIHTKNNPTAVPLLGYGRRFGEFMYKYYNGEDVSEYDWGGTKQLMEYINMASPFKLPTELTAKGLLKTAGQNIGTHKFADVGLKVIFGYDSFRDQYIDQRYAEKSSGLKGLDDENVMYLYKLMALGLAEISDTDDNMISAPRIQSVVESVITSPTNNIFVGLAYGMISDVAEFLIPPAREEEKDKYSLFSVKNIPDLSNIILKRVVEVTDKDKAIRQRMGKVYEEKARIEAITLARDEKINRELKILYGKDPELFLDNVDNYIYDNGYYTDDELSTRIYNKANRLEKKQELDTIIPEEHKREVNLLSSIDNTKDLSEMLRYLYKDDIERASIVSDYIIEYGASPDRVYNALDMYIADIQNDTQN